MTALVGLAGYARAGKDTVGGYLVRTAGFQRVSFADSLRAVLLATDPNVPIQGEQGPVVHAPVSAVVQQLGWEGAKAMLPEHHGSVRQLLQRLGTDAGRNVLGPDVWVNAAFLPLQDPKGRFVFTDVRFPNEASAIRERGGALVRVLRPGTRPVNDHPSETALDDYRFDYQLYAEDVPQLYAVTQAMVETFGWDR